MPPALPRFLVLYTALFAAFGVASPFFAAFLASRGLRPEAIGLVLAAGTATRLVAGPVGGRIADRLQTPRSGAGGLCGGGCLRRVRLPAGRGRRAAAAGQCDARGDAGSADPDRRCAGAGRRRASACATAGCGAPGPPHSSWARCCRDRWSPVLGFPRSSGSTARCWASPPAAPGSCRTCAFATGRSDRDGSIPKA